LKAATNPESGLIQYGYDPNGNLTTKTDARAIVTNFGYDGLNRVKTRSYANEPSGSETPDVTYFYDNLPNAKGKLIKVSSSVSTTEYTAFDILGRVTASKQTTDGTDYNSGYAYNLSGALVEQTYPSGRVVKNVLDNSGDLSIVQSKKNSTSGYWNYASSFSYNAAGAVTSMQLGNGRWESTTFNSRLQPTQIALGATPGATNLLDLDYSYGTTANNGNVMSQTITVPTVGSNTGFTAVQNYSYDSLNRLKDAIENITPNGGSQTQSWKQTFTFDRYGNRRFDESNTTMPTSFTNQALTNPTISTSNNRLNSTGWDYDSSGNTTDDPNGREFVYDAENKQVKVTDGAEVIGEYWYDGDGRRVRKHVPSTGEVTVFVYDASGKLIAEYSTIVETTNAKVGYVTNDHLGSPRINTDANGAVTSRHDYHPFGEAIATSQRTTGLGYAEDTVRKQFTGYERDDETELDFAQARYYGHSNGRFTSPDSFANDTHPAAPQSWNLYAYARNNPLYFVDHNGDRVYVGHITDQADRDEFLRRANSTYGCESCVGVDADGYLTVDTTGLSQEVIDSTQFLTDAINSTDLSQLFNVDITNNNPDVGFGDSGTRRGVPVRQADGRVINTSAINIRLDFGDDVHVRGNAQLQASFLNMVFAHEVSHWAPSRASDPTAPGVRGPVDNPVNKIRLALGLPLRAEYRARSLFVGGLVYLKFGDPVMFDFGYCIPNGPEPRALEGNDGLEVQDQPGRIILWWQNRVKR
jgi:RHS repeat-associated protein